MSDESSATDKTILVGRAACVDGTTHVWPVHLTNGGHTFGAAATRTDDGDVVTLYADVYGVRTGELDYPADVWDRFVDRVRNVTDAPPPLEPEAVERASQLLDPRLRWLRALGHSALDTRVRIDAAQPRSRQVALTRDGRTVTDSIASGVAFVNAVQRGEFTTAELLLVTKRVDADEYHAGTT